MLAGGITEKKNRQYAISRFKIVHSSLHLVSYLNKGNFCNQSKRLTLCEVLCKFS